MAEVQARLTGRFRHVDPAVVEAAVHLAHSELTGHVRDFVPVLVEHVARDRLASLEVRPEVDVESHAEPQPPNGAGSTGEARPR